MKSWFWPGLTLTAAMTSLALWFGVEQLEADIARRTSFTLAPFAWAGFDIEGRDVTLKGVAPDPATQKAAESALQNVPQIHQITDLTSVLPSASPYLFQITRNEDGLVLSGFIPENALRDKIMEAAEEIVLGSSLDDQMAIARGSWPQFADSALFALDVIKAMKEGEISLSDGALSVTGIATSADTFSQMTDLLTKPLPFGLKLQESNIAQP
ncbi:BON domain-containing protein [Brucella sp. BE17]|uniref:BON domain-containing protein n=1 Tax=Brucella sp. BE17 TaxID=3142977 RepID=UPI0031BA3999